MCECCGGHTHKVALTVKDMSNNDDVLKLKENLNSLKGIKSFEFNLNDSKANIEYSPNDINTNIIMDTLNKAGFEVEE